MKRTLRMVVCAVLAIGCLPVANFKTEASISRVTIVNQEIILRGSGLLQIDLLKVKEGSKIYHLAIVSKSNTEITARPLANASFAADNIFIIE